MPDLSDYKDGITICIAFEWSDQKECILKRVEKSANRDCCMWFDEYENNTICKNPNAGKWKDGVQ